VAREVKDRGFEKELTESQKVPAAILLCSFHRLLDDNHVIY